MIDPLYDFIVDTDGHAPLPDQVGQLLEIVSRDLRPERGLSAVHDAEGRLWVWECGADGGGAWKLEATESDASNIVALADWLQRQLQRDEGLEASHPPCGEHPHSMMAKVIGDDAWWCCRYTGEPPMRRIGDQSDVESKSR